MTKKDISLTLEELVSSLAELEAELEALLEADISEIVEFTKDL